MIPKVIQRTVDLNVPKRQRVEVLPAPLYQLENGGHTFEITVLQDGEAATLSSVVTARFIRADDTTVLISGTLSGNVVTVSLPQMCYNMPGRFGFVIFVSGSDVMTAVYAAAGQVYRTVSDIVADPDGAVPDVAAIQAIIDDAESATTAATTAAENASAAVSYLTQSKTDSEKAQARENIGAAACYVSDTTLMITD